MKTILIVLLSSFFLATSCSKEETPDTQTDENGVVISLPYQWKKSLHQSGVVSNSSVRKTIYYNDNIAIPTTNGGNNRLLTLINPDNGDIIWSWDDRYQPETEDIFITHYHQHNNLLTYQIGDRSYCINLDNGTTHWKFRRDKPFDVRIVLYDSFYSTYGYITNEDDNQEHIAYLGDIDNGNLTEFLRANLSSSYVSSRGVGGIDYVGKLPSDDSLLLVSYSEPLSGWKIKSFFGLYDTNTNQWIWEGKQLIDPPTVNSGLFNVPLFYNDKVVASIGKNLVCRSLITGDEVWKRSFPQDFLFSGFIIEEGKIIANNEDEYTYCLNPDSGSVLWKTETSGTSGRISYLNGVVYFVGGATGKLHALDINTGEHVWKIDAHKMGEPDNSNFKTNAVYVFPKEGDNPAKIIALSHLNAYCFEAYQ